MSPQLAQPGHAAVVGRRLLLGVERTCRSSGPTSEFDPGCVKTRTPMVGPVALLAGDCLLQAYEVGHSTAPPALLRREERDTLEAVL